MSGDRWGVKTKTGVAGPYGRDEAIRAGHDLGGPVVPWTFEDAPELPRPPMAYSPPDEATQWGPGSLAAVARGCSCDPIFVGLAEDRWRVVEPAEPHQAYRAGDMAWPATINPDCPIHRPGAAS